MDRMDRSSEEHSADDGAKALIWECKTLQEYSDYLVDLVRTGERISWNPVLSYDVFGVTDMDGQAVFITHNRPSDMVHAFGYMLGPDQHEMRMAPTLVAQLEWPFLQSTGQKLGGAQTYELPLFRIAEPYFAGNPGILLVTTRRLAKQDASEGPAHTAAAAASVEEDALEKEKEEEAAKGPGFWGKSFLRGGMFRFLMCQRMVDYGCTGAVRWMSELEGPVENMALNSQESYYYLLALQSVLPVVLAQQTLNEDGSHFWSKTRFHEQIVHVETLAQNFSQKKNAADAQAIAMSLTGQASCGLQNNLRARYTVDFGKNFYDTCTIFHFTIKEQTNKENSQQKKKKSLLDISTTLTLFQPPNRSDIFWTRASRAELRRRGRKREDLRRLSNYY